MIQLLSLIITNMRISRICNDNNIYIFFLDMPSMFTCWSWGINSRRDKLIAKVKLEYKCVSLSSLGKIIIISKKPTTNLEFVSIHRIRDYFWVFTTCYIMKLNWFWSTYLDLTHRVSYLLCGRNIVLLLYLIDN